MNTNKNTTKETELDMIIRAARYYLKYSAIEDTDDQVAKLMKTTTAFDIINMAVMRGFKFKR